jgi:hypothetical protein
MMIADWEGAPVTLKFRELAAVATLAFAALAAGCGSTVDSAEMEEDLATQLSEQAGVDAADVSVDCPDDEEAEEGNEFECVLTAPNGDEVTFEGEITDDEGGFKGEVPEQQFR